MCAGPDRQVVVAFGIDAVVRLDGGNIPQLQQPFHQAGKPDIAKRMGRRTNAAEVVDVCYHFLQRQIAVAVPDVPAVIDNAVGQQVTPVGGDFNAAQDQQALLAADAFDRLRGLVGIVLGDAHAVESEGLGAPDQVKRFKPVVIGMLGMTMGIDPHDPSECRQALREARTRN